MHNLKAQLFQAQGFLEAFRRCDPELELYDGSLIATPALVCAAFSVEVGLKLLLTRCGRAAKGHDIFKLYRRLPRHLQFQIRHGTTYARREFVKEFLKARNAFIEWRYVYESQDVLVVSVIFLGRLAKTVTYICEKQEDVG
jgi:hypothetical protein